ncbi:MAG: hypothetical protein NTV39_01830 [Candidatus Saccharibacteria bacterium]|nr:hypothetical protein [Candidatus Saccharibacteria bacterium]
MTQKVIRPGLLGNPEQQVEKSREFLNQHGVVRPIPDMPEFTPQTISEELLLATYLCDNDNGEAWLRTLKAWWRFINAPKGFVKAEWEGYTVEDDEIRQIPGYKHRCGIRWVAYDPLANLGFSPRACWDKPDRHGHLAGIEVLMAMGLSQKYVKSWDDHTPSPNMAGLQVREEQNPEAGTPFACRADERKVLKLSVVKAAITSPNFANPTVREL